MERNGDLLHADTWPTDLRGPSPAPPSPLHSAAPGINGRGGEGEMFERVSVRACERACMRACLRACVRACVHV